MRMRSSGQPPRREPDLTSLINVIFLILIFFMIAGTMRPFSSRGLKLAKVPEANAQALTAGRLIAHADGRLIYRDQELAIEAIAGTIGADTALDKAAPFTLIADARLEAGKAISVIAALRQAGIANIAILTRR